VEASAPAYRISNLRSTNMSEFNNENTKPFIWTHQDC